MGKSKPIGTTTEQEFSTATRLLISCRATLSCGCQFDEKQADWLYYQCKQYIEDYKKRIK
jgi:hypothetical protein